jgi:small subunit ribosomal protein S20
MVYYVPMPIIKRAAKKLRHDRKRTVETMAARATLRNIIKAFRNSPTKKSLDRTFQALDKAAKRHIIHTNKASRLKSRLSRLLAKK